jgi:hypothetical protein
MPTKNTTAKPSNTYIRPLFLIGGGPKRLGPCGHMGSSLVLNKHAFETVVCCRLNLTPLLTPQFCFIFTFLTCKLVLLCHYALIEGCWFIKRVKSLSGYFLFICTFLTCKLVLCGHMGCRSGCEQ